MAPQISFVIPVLNEQGAIEGLLKLLHNNFPNSELIVVDGGSVDHTQSLVRDNCTLLVESDAGRAVQMNAGAASASGEYLFFLHADSLPCFKVEDLEPYLAQHPKWGFFAVRLRGKQPFFRVIEYCMNFRSRTTKVATGDQLIYVRRDVFQRMTGFAQIPLMEDVEACKRLRSIARPEVLPLRVETSTRRWEQHGILRTVLRMWALRLAYFMGASPERLRRHYFAR